MLDWFEHHERKCKVNSSKTDCAFLRAIRARCTRAYQEPKNVILMYARMYYVVFYAHSKLPGVNCTRIDFREKVTVDVISKCAMTVDVISKCAMKKMASTRNAQRAK